MLFPGESFSLEFNPIELEPFRAISKSVSELIRNTFCIYFGEKG